MEKETDIISKIGNDEFYSKFLTKNSPCADISKYLSISEQVKKLGHGIDLITKELQKCVLEKHEDLLKQANHATKLENILDVMNGNVSNIVANAEKLRIQINSPYDALEKHTKILNRLHNASHILRQVSHIQQLSKRLGNTNENTQKALILQELEQLAADDELKSIDAVVFELRNIRSERQRIVQQTSSSLHQGILNENSAQTAAALQIFMNLGILEDVLLELVNEALSECEKSIKLSFDVIKVKQGSGKMNLSSSQGFRNKVWMELEKSFSEVIQSKSLQIKFLQITLSNTNLQIEVEVATRFWNMLGNMLRDVIGSAPLPVQQMLEEDYPRLLKCYFEVFKRLNNDRFGFDRTVLEKWETAYLSTSLTELLDPIQAMFSPETCAPSHESIDKIVRIISSNLSVALIEENLCEKIARNIAKCIKMFEVKTEQQLDTGPDSAQVIGGSANAGQQKNVHLANRIFYIQTQIQRILTNMEKSLASAKISAIIEALQNLDNLSNNILQPLIVSINSTIETIIVTIHLETDWSRIQAATNKNMSCSPYMKELNQFIHRVYNTYLSHFENQRILKLKCRQIAERCIELFVRHTALLRPASSMSPGGRQRLKVDHDQLESTLKILCADLSDLGKPYKLLRSMRSLMVKTPVEIISSYQDGSVVVPSTILLFLFSFAGKELASPHQNTGWSLQKLSAWLDEHPSESDRLNLIAGALQRYESLIRQKNSMNYDPVYPMMSNFLQKFIT